MKYSADTETSEKASKKAATRGALHPDELETINKSSSATVPDINEINTIHETYPDGRVFKTSNPSITSNCPIPPNPYLIHQLVNRLSQHISSSNNPTQPMIYLSSN
jgi:hypothetical protein